MQDGFHVNFCDLFSLIRTIGCLLNNVESLENSFRISYAGIILIITNAGRCNLLKLLSRTPAVLSRNPGMIFMHPLLSSGPFLCTFVVFVSLCEISGMATEYLNPL